MISYAANQQQKDIFIILFTDCTYFPIVNFYPALNKLFHDVVPPQISKCSNSYPKELAMESFRQADKVPRPYSEQAFS